MQEAQTIKRHVLPDEETNAGEDSSWFFHQNPFERQEILHLVHYKRNTLGIQEDGRYSKKPSYTYPHLLPDGSLCKAFYEPMAAPIFDYLNDEGIQQHTELLNLKSSQAACLNLLFPLRMNPDLATTVMQVFLPSLSVVTGIEFEYTAQDELKKDLGCTQWLGEPPNGKRGQNRTSIDAAIFWNSTEGKRCATLIEFKYTERSFGVCSAFDKANHDEKLECLQNSYVSNCLLTKGGPYRNRKYWQRLSDSGLPATAFHQVSGCPFRGPFYQLMRQYLISKYMEEAEIVDHAEIRVLHFQGNQALEQLPSELKALGHKTVIDSWNALTSGESMIQHFSAESLMAAYDKTYLTDPGWRDFIRTKYRI